MFKMLASQRVVSVLVCFQLDVVMCDCTGFTVTVIYV